MSILQVPVSAQRTPSSTHCVKVGASISFTDDSMLVFSRELEQTLTPPQLLDLQAGCGLRMCHRAAAICALQLVERVCLCLPTRMLWIEAKKAPLRDL